MTNLGLEAARFSNALAGRYVIERELGAGGMAVVYLARDVRHDRRVALKVLRPDLAAAIGVERFLNEIKTTANLQHPHIVPLHDSGEVDGVVFYVMPFIEGEGLRERLTRERQLPVADAVRIATQVASALDYAHRHGVVHRDIKPENILIHDGTATVADFGISLAVQSAAGERLTQTGLSLGTPNYMAPEQAMGERSIDGRTDIYALSAVLYEMLVGEAPFAGPTLQAIIARSMSEQPRSVTGQRHAVPPHIDAAIQRGLEKLPADRFATAAEFAAALEGDGRAVGRAVAGTSHAAAGNRWRSAAIGLGVSTLVLAAALAAVAVGRGATGRSASLPTVISYIAPSAQAPSELRDVALSPDGTTLAYVSNASADGGRIWLRRLRDTATTVVPGTDGARSPFWAPDGSGIGFIAGGWLETVTLRDGAVHRLVPAPMSLGAAWGPDGTIVYSPTYRHLWRVSATGGPARRALGTDDDSSSGARDPSFLPDGHHVLYWQTDYQSPPSVWIADLETGRSQRFTEGITSPRYVDGNLLYFQFTAQTTLEQPAVLVARPFDWKSRTFSGQAFPVTGRIDRPDQAAIVSATADFVVVREAAALQDAGGGSHGTIYWLDRATGKASAPLKGASGVWGFRMSHDGRRVAMGGSGLWIYDPARDVSTRLDLKGPTGTWPQTWSPDDRELAVSSGPWLPISPVDGSAPTRMLHISKDAWVQPTDWSRDGRVYYILEPSDSTPQWIAYRHDLATDRKERVAKGSGNVMDVRVSPDDRWLAWESDESGRHEIYLGSAAGGAPIRVSKDGGGSPRWRADGKELFFIGGDGRIISVSVQLGGERPVVGEPARVADLVIHPDPFGRDAFLDTRFEPTPDGRRFLVQTPYGVGAHRLTMIQGWRNRGTERARDP